MELQLTDEMKNVLRECHTRELNGDEPCSEKIINSVPELLIHHLVELRMHVFKNHERKVAYFITEKGKEKLKEL
jgi:hypothetical protein